MSISRSFRQFIPRTTGQRQPNGTIEGNPVSGRDENHFRLATCTNGRTDDVLVSIVEKTIRPFLRLRFLVGTKETGLGATDGWSVREKPQVTGQAEPPRMNQTLAVREYDVRCGHQPLQRAQNQGGALETIVAPARTGSPVFPGTP